jgi:hypothetical protein
MHANRIVGCLLKDDSNPFAAVESSKFKADSQLAPNTSAKAESCSTFEERIKLASLKIKAVDAKINAAPPANKADRFNFALIERSLKKRMGETIATGRQ